MKKILWLEDDIDVVAAVINAFRDKCDFTVVDNFFELSGRLFENPGVEEYDMVILDLTIETPGIPLATYMRKIPQMFQDKNGDSCDATVVSGIALLGLDYYERIVCTDKRFQDCKNCKFVLMTGHGLLLERYGIIDRLDVKVVKKRGKGSFEELSEVLG